MAGSNPAMIVRVAATIEELKKNLAEGKSQIETTTAAMQKMAASFSGDKLFQQAMNVTAAVNAIGGASKLTEAEQARVNATLDKALEKYRVLGREAPAGMQELADATRKADTETAKLATDTTTAEKAHSGLRDSVRGLITDFAAMFTARAAFNFVSDVIHDASALQDLSNQTHINVEEIQLLTGAMSEFGVDADTLAKGLFGLSRRVAGGDDSVAKALETMGLSLEDLDGLEGEQLFLKMEHGLAQLQGGLRDTTASELFGSKLGMAMAGASEGIDDALDAARRLNTVMSKESVEALDRYGESIERAQRSLSAMAANMIGPVAEGFNVVVGAAERGAPKWDIFVAMLKDFAASNSLTGASTEHLATLLDHLNQTTDQHTVATAKATEAHTKHAGAVQVTANESRQLLADVKTLNEAWAAGAKFLDEFEIKTHGIAMANLREEATERSKLLAERNKEVVAGLSAIQAIEKQSADFLLKQTLSTTDYQIAKVREWEADTIAAFKGTDEQLAAYTAAVQTRAKQQIDALTAVTATLTAQEKAMNDLARDAVTSFAVIGKGANETSDANTKAAAASGTAYQDSFAKSAAAFEQFKGIVVAGTGIMQSMLPVTDAASWSQRQLDMQQAQRDRGEIFLTGMGGGMPTRDSGGPVTGGRPYAIGRPEIFVPERSGAIVPIGGASVGGGTTVVNHIYITQPLGTPDAIAAAVDDALMQRQRAIGVRH